MDRDKKIAEFIRREVLWLLIGFELAGLLCESFHFSDWSKKNGLLLDVIPVVFFWPD